MKSNNEELIRELDAIMPHPMPSRSVAEDLARIMQRTVRKRSSKVPQAKLQARERPLAEEIWKHREMWTWIAKETKRRQMVIKEKDYFGARDDVPVSNSYCCEVAGWDCAKCPLKWSALGKCGDSDSPYSQWKEAVRMRDWVRAAYYAAIIARLPEKDA